MTEQQTHELILKKLDHQSDRLSCIENAVAKIAVQEEKIESVREQVAGLWRKYDAAFGPDGTIAKLQASAAACPKEDLKNALARQWAAIALLASLVAGALLRAFGVIGA